MAAKEHNLVTEAVTTIGTISASLPWSKYSSLLRHYLRRLPVEKHFQKVIARYGFPPYCTELHYLLFIIYLPHNKTGKHTITTSLLTLYK